TAPSERVQVLSAKLHPPTGGLEIKLDLIHLDVDKARNLQFVAESDRINVPVVLARLELRLDKSRMWRTTGAGAGDNDAATWLAGFVGRVDDLSPVLGMLEAFRRNHQIPDRRPRDPFRRVGHDVNVGSRPNVEHRVTSIGEEFSRCAIDIATADVKDLD